MFLRGIDTPMNTMIKVGKYGIFRDGGILVVRGMILKWGEVIAVYGLNANWDHQYSITFTSQQQIGSMIKDI